MRVQFLSTYIMDERHSDRFEFEDFWLVCHIMIASMLYLYHKLAQEIVITIWLMKLPCTMKALIEWQGIYLSVWLKMLMKFNN